MADNSIVQGLFGVDPAQYQQQQQQLTNAQAEQFAQLSGAQQGQYGMFRGGQMLGNAVGGLMGAQDPIMKKASDLKQIASQFDTTTPEGLTQMAQAAMKAGYPAEAQRAIAAAQEMTKAGLGIKKTQAEVSKMEMSAAQEEKLRAELSNLGPNASEQDVINVVSKYGSPDKILQVLTASQDRKAKLAAAQAGAGGIGEAGPVGKAGAYRDINGMVHGAGEMSKVNQEFAGNQKLLDVLNTIEQKDIKQAESIIDWTTKEGVTKAAGAKFSPETVNAQSKLALAQLKKQIESLPPGSASNADMVAAMKDFPGYGDAENLRLWLNRTKSLVQKNVTGLEDLYGLKSRVKSSGDIGESSTPSSTKGKKTITLKNGTTVTVED